MCVHIVLTELSPHHIPARSEWASTSLSRDREHRHCCRAGDKKLTRSSFTFFGGSSGGTWFVDFGREGTFRDD